MPCCNTKDDMHQEVKLEAQLDRVDPDFRWEYEGPACVYLKMVKQFQVEMDDRVRRGRAWENNL